MVLIDEVCVRVDLNDRYYVMFKRVSMEKISKVIREFLSSFQQCPDPLCKKITAMKIGF